MAFDCGFYTECCHALVDACREAGVRGELLQQFADPWEAISVVAYGHYRQGRIGLYPEMCMADPGYDPDEILEPDPMFPEPDHDEILEEIDPWFPG